MGANTLTKESKVSEKLPTSIDEVLKDEFKANSK
jgi:hypothetical protein